MEERRPPHLVGDVTADDDLVALGAVVALDDPLLALNRELLLVCSLTCTTTFLVVRPSPTDTALSRLKARFRAGRVFGAAGRFEAGFFGATSRPASRAARCLRAATRGMSAVNFASAKPDVLRAVAGRRSGPPPSRRPSADELCASSTTT